MENKFPPQVEERLVNKKDLPTKEMLATHTVWIALNSRVLFLHSIFGAYLNDRCHIQESYHFNTFIKILTNA